MVSNKEEIKLCRALSGAGIPPCQKQLCGNLKFSLPFYFQHISMYKMHNTQL